MRNLQEELKREKDINTLEKDIKKCNEEVIIKLKEVVDIIQCENGKLLHELQYIKDTLKTNGAKNKKRSKTVENTHEESERHTQENHPAQPYNTKSPKGQPTPLHTVMEINIEKLKQEAITLNDKITQCYGQNVEELGKEQKDLIKQAVKVTLGIVILNSENRHKDVEKCTI